MPSKTLMLFLLNFLAVAFSPPLSFLLGGRADVQWQAGGVFKVLLAPVHFPYCCCCFSSWNYRNRK
jgi:hypothetical protein